jgi:CheY-like chemotaxis protein
VSTAGEGHVLAAARLLIVDDDPEFVSYVRSVLGLVGVSDAATANSGLDALEQIAANPPYDLVITDVRMPPPSGLQLVAMARTAGYDVPFLVVTAFPDDQVTTTVDKLADVVLLAKPFDPDDLVTTAALLVDYGTGK